MWGEGFLDQSFKKQNFRLNSFNSFNSFNYFFLLQSYAKICFCVRIYIKYVWKLSFFAHFSPNYEL